MEDWLTKNCANYLFVATEENNVASTNLFTLKCNYIKLISLNIFIQPINPPFINKRDPLDDIKFEKLSIGEAVSYYKTHVVGKCLYPSDINLILKEKLSLGTWLCFFKEDINVVDTSQRSWAIFSMWNTCEAYKSHVTPTFRHVNDDNPNKLVFSDLHEKPPLGFLLIYGLYGEGEGLEELVKSLWSFAVKMAGNVKDCKAIMTELGFSDPIRELVPRDSSLSCIDDIWYVKKVRNTSKDDDDGDLICAMCGVGNVFVDPRDF